MESDMANIEELAAQTRRLEDIEKIKQLKARYCAFCDDNYNPQGIASLFTDDGVWDGGELGKAEGHAAIVKFFQRAPSVFSFAIHHVMNPIIEVHGDIATGRWYLHQPLTRKSREGETAMWLAGRYEDEYVRVGDEWKFGRLKFIARFLARYDEGWARGQA
jgi:SnoaL-like protein